MLNTLVHELDIHKGSQWAVFVATPEGIYAHMGALVFGVEFFLGNQLPILQNLRRLTKELFK